MPKGLFRLEKLIDIFLCICILILSLIKGGFYSNDTIWFNVVSFALYFILISKMYSSKGFKIKTLDILVLLLPLSYLLPIIFKTYANYVDSFTEMLRYINFAAIYYIVKSSDNKDYYINTLIILGVTQSIVGIDSIASKVLQPIFNFVNSGYLDIPRYADRMSGTIQYANTFAILIAISALILFDRLTIKLPKQKFNIFFATFFILNSSILLSNSRVVLLMYSIAIIFYLAYLGIQKKENVLDRVIIILTQIPILLIYTSITDMLINKSLLAYIYIFFAAFILVSYLLGIILFNNLNLDKFKDILVIKKSKRLILVVIGVTILYLILGFNLTKNLEISSSGETKSITKYAYNLVYSEVNNLEISIEHEDYSQYSIQIYEETEKERTLLNTFDSSIDASKNIYYEFVPNTVDSKICIVFNCKSGSISVQKLSVNGKSIPLDYLLLPSNIISRLNSGLKIDDSFTSRITYAKDAIKLIKKSPIFGLGGEGFKDKYKEVQDENYTSTEVHNSFLQIFVEVGIVGGTVALLIVILAIFKSKYSIIKLSSIMFIAHSFTDLNFSYMLSICVFAIFIALLEEKEIEKSNQISK